MTTDSPVAVGQQRLLDLHTRGDVLDDNLVLAPGKYGAEAPAPHGLWALQQTSRVHCASTRIWA